MPTYDKRSNSLPSTNLLAVDSQIEHQHFDSVITLHITDNFWHTKAVPSSSESLKVVERKVTGLLNKLVAANFDSIADQVIQWANKSENEKDGHTLIQVIRLVFEQAINEANMSEIFARLCRKMMENVSPRVQDDGIRNNKGKPIGGGQLFRKYLLNRCQEDFERDWLSGIPMSNEDKSAQKKGRTSFVPRRRVTLKKPDGTEINLEDLAQSSSHTAPPASLPSHHTLQYGDGFSSISPTLDHPRAAIIRIESEAQRKARLTEARASAEEEGNSPSIIGSPFMPQTSARIRSHEDGKDSVQDTVQHSNPDDRGHVAQKAKRQRLGLVKFLGELFKLQMLTERIMHNCVKLLISNIDNQEKEGIEALCKLLTTVGGALDSPKARAHFDVYFSRIKEVARTPNITSRLRFILVDLIELREHRWAARTAIGSKRDGTLNFQTQVYFDEWTITGGNAFRVPAKVNDLSHSRRNSKDPPTTLGSKGVVAGRKKTVHGGEFLLHTDSNANTLPMPENWAAETSDGADKPTEPAQYTPWLLQSRSKLLEAEAGQFQSPAGDSKAGVDAAEEKEAVSEMSEEVAKKKIDEDVKEFFAVRSLTKAEVYFTDIPAAHHHRFVDALVTKAVESKEADAKLVADFFEQTVTKGTCSAEAFETGLLPVAEVIDDIAIDAPKAIQLFAMMVKGAGLDEARRSSLASKSLDSDKLLSLTYNSYQCGQAQTAQHDTEVSIFVDIVMGLRSTKKGALLFKVVPPEHHPAFIAKVACATFAMEETQVTLIAESCREAIVQGTCSLKNFKNGLAIVARMINKTTVTTQFLKLATMVREVGMGKADREELAIIFGQLSNCFMEATLFIDQKSDEQNVTEFLEQLVQIGMCSTALVPADERPDTIRSIVNDMASQAPNALRKLSLMVKGGCSD